MKETYLRLIGIVLDECLITFFFDEIRPSRGKFQVTDPPVLRLELEVSIDSEELGVNKSKKM
jgi:hypothetical protein